MSEELKPCPLCDCDLLPINFNNFLEFEERLIAGEQS